MVSVEGGDLAQKILAILAANGDIIFDDDVDDVEVYKLTDKGRRRGMQAMQRIGAEDAIIVSMMIVEA